MKVKLLQRWLAAPGKEPGAVVNVRDELVEGGIERGLCERVEKPLNKMNTAELEKKALDLGVDISGANNNRARAALIQAKLDGKEPGPAEPKDETGGESGPDDGNEGSQDEKSKGE